MAARVCLAACALLAMGAKRYARDRYLFVFAFVCLSPESETAKKQRQMFDKDEGKDKDLSIPNWRFGQAWEEGGDGSGLFGTTRHLSP